MRLVLREYLSMLKEAGELDDLLPDLLVAMGLDPLSRPIRGIRQFGVDVSAVGADPEDGRRKLFLFVVKQGDITRSNWDTGEQSVRPSLNEIFDTYLHTQVRPEHKDLPKKIILTTNGELRQNVEPNWAGYARKHASDHSAYGELQLEFWGADHLAILLEQYLLDEYLFPESAQKQIRKTIALADQNEEEPRFFYSLVEETLFQRGLPVDQTPSAQRKRQHALRLINLSLNIVFHWCRESGNLRPALLCAERALLRTWGWIREFQFFDKHMQGEFSRIHDTFLAVARAYAAKIQSHCAVRDGLLGYEADELEYPIRVFEVMGILGELALALVYRMDFEEEGVRQDLLREGEEVVAALAAVIRNNPAASSPCYDGHEIEVGIGLLALSILGTRGQAASWLEELGNRVLFAYVIGRRFPVSSDSYDDLIALRFDENFPKEPLMNLSTLVPLMADWFAVLDLSDPYDEFKETVMQVLPKTDLQMWFPDEGVEEILYKANAGFQGGKTLTSIRLPAKIEDLRARAGRLMGQSVFEKLSFIEQGWPVLGLIASRHFRTPLMPEYWQQSLLSVPGSPDLGSSGEPEDTLEEAR